MLHEVGSPLDPLADAIADRVWARLQERLSECERPQLINLSDAASRLGIKRTKLYMMIGTGEFPEKLIKRIGRRLLVASSELDQWIAAR